MVNNPPTDKIAAPIAAAVQNLVVLVVSETENVAKRIESHMRNAGHPVKAAWVTDLEDIEDALTRGAPDLLLCAENLEGAPLRDVVQLCARLCPDLPVLLLSSTFSQEEAVAALAAGARDLVAQDDLRHLRHLELVMMREFISHRNLRELRITRTRLADFESRHLQLLSGTKDAVAHIQEGILSHVNPSLVELLGYSQIDELVGTPLMDIISSEFQSKTKEHLKLLSRGKLDGKTMECSLVRQDGSTTKVSALLTASTVDGEHFIEMLIRAETASIAPIATPVETQPSGRLAFIEALHHLPTKNAKGVNAPAILMVDDFAGTEDRLGPRDTEEALLKLMEWVKQRLAPNESLYRYSTAEIGILLSRNTVSDIENFCELLAREIPQQIFALQSHESPLSISVTAYPLAGGEDPVSLCTDLAREVRKLSTKAGGKQFLILGPTAKASTTDREDARRATQVKRALEDNRLKLAYQSIASLEGDTRQHFDVLLRLVDEQGKELHAGEFIRAAEKFNLMRSIDRWVTHRALKLLAKRDTAKESSSLFVKLSEDTLKDAESFGAWLLEAVKERALKADELVFELQEIHLQSHIRKAKALVKTILECGATVCIEKFGVGANTVQLTEHIPSAYYKFHPEFTSKFADKEMQKKMATLMDIAKQKSIKTIVCHVEDANVMARLWQMGVNYIQGYHVQEPEVVLLSTDLFARSTA